jgi:hypothetical protein
MSQIVQVPITTDREKFMSREHSPGGIELWEQQKGKLIRVYLPPVLPSPGYFKCGCHLVWRVVEDVVEQFRPEVEREDWHCVCAHEIDID